MFKCFLHFALCMLKIYKVCCVGKSFQRHFTYILYKKSFYIALIIYILAKISVSALEIRKHNKPEIEIDYPRLLLHRSVWNTPIKRKCLSRMNYCVYGYGNTPGESNRIRLRSPRFTYPYTATQTLRLIYALFSMR